MMKEKLSRKRKVLRILRIISGIIISCSFGVLVGFFFAYQKGLPKIKDLEEIKPSIVTEVYSSDGQIIKRYFLERRIIVSSKDIPDVVKKAFIAAEDSRFYKHWGVDFIRVIPALIKDIRHLKAKEGFSTITMQLARTLFLTREKTVKRKIREILLTFQIERKYTKEQILTYYLNQIYLGHGNYGIEAASEFYFGKHVKELTLVEAAVLAGLPRSPARYSPLLHPDNAERRKRYVLRRMLEEGYISKDEYRRAVNEKIVVKKRKPYEEKEYYAYFVEEVRKFIAKNYGTKSLYRGGLKVYTTIDLKAQKLAYTSLREGLREVDKREGWRNDKFNFIRDENKEPEDVELKEWKSALIEKGRVIKGVVLKVFRNKAIVKIKDYKAALYLKDSMWVKTNSFRKILKRGDLIEVKIKRIDLDKKEIYGELEQEPLVEGAFLAINPHTGEILAMVGGYSFSKSEFNRAIQAKRQPGSTFKPIIYSAALSNGYTPSSTFFDEPVTFVDKWTNEEWSPLNFDEVYKGLCTIRRGLEESRNVITAKLLDAITPELAVEYAKKFGFKSEIKPYLSIALGTMEVSLLEVVSAFSVFPNEGIRVEPFFIKKIVNRDGEVLYEHKTSASEVLSPEVAYQMSYLLEGVIKRGTARKAAKLGLHAGGKTGTTDDFTDAWFIGFTPSVVAGVWVGFDEKKTIGYMETGARAALPVWMKFMEGYYDDNEKKKEDFKVPPGINFVKVDYFTGLLATPDCRYVIDEAFIPGTEPQRFCTEEDHLLVMDYYTKNISGWE